METIETQAPAAVAAIFAASQRARHAAHKLTETEEALTFAQLDVLHILAEHGGTVERTVQIVAPLAVAPTVVTGMIDRLQAQGYVTRTVWDGSVTTADRRAIRVALTEKGWEAYRRGCRVIGGTA